MEASNGTLDAKLAAAIDAIDPAGLGYDDWIVLMGAMKDAGISYADVDAWNRRDPERYDERANRRHWDSLNNPTSPQVAAATIFKAASANGWRWNGPSTAAGTLPKRRAIPHTETGPTFPIVSTQLDVAAPEPPDLSPADQMREQLAAMFYQGETVNTFVDSPTWNEKQGKWQPIGWGEFSDVDSFWMDGYTETVLGSVNPEAGAWVRVNPMDGQGGRDGNVTAYRHVLVESDSLPAAEQMEAYLRLNLPCSAIVDSGNKSVHAFVRVDADNPEQYRERVSWLYGFLRANGLEVDAANRNPARWARLAGATRNGHVQRLLATHAGASSWDEWRAWVDAQPAEGTATDMEAKRPRLEIVRECEHTGAKTPDATPAIIDGLLRRGHKMLITGPSKASKTWMLYGLGLKLATGGLWLDRHQCERSRVLLVNTELDTNSHHRRVDWIRRTWGIEVADYADTLDSVSLRGLQLDAKTFVDELTAITSGRRYDAVLLDSVYKLFPGDENSAQDVRLLFEQMDRLLAMGTSVIFTHHHAKGAAGGKAAIDRGSGSGVFGRDPDALLDVSPLVVDPDGAAWEYLRMHDYRTAEGSTVTATALRMSYTLREFASPAPLNVIFRCPVHDVDHAGELDECKVRGSAEEYGSRGGQSRAAKYADQWADTDEALGRIVADLIAQGVTPTRSACLAPLNEWRKANGMDEWARATLDKETRPNGHLSWHPTQTPPYALERAS